MKISYHASFSINDYLKSLIVEKIEKLQKNSRPLMEVDVYFKLKDGPESAKDKELEFKVHVPGQVIFGKSHADSFEKAIPEVTEKVRKQLDKYMSHFDPRKN